MALEWAFEALLVMCPCVAYFLSSRLPFCPPTTRYTQPQICRPARNGIRLFNAGLSILLLSAIMSRGPQEQNSAATDKFPE